MRSRIFKLFMCKINCWFATEFCVGDARIVTKFTMHWEFSVQRVRLLATRNFYRSRVEFIRISRNFDNAENGLTVGLSINDFENAGRVHNAT
jgi:hypothetical protein